jgi:uncharacterized protein (DUF1684 family)
MEKNKRLRIQVVLFDDTELIWISPFDDKKSSLAAFKIARFVEIDGEYYNVDGVKKWKPLDDA